jgi:SAM-dependent methyltransferase
MTQTWNAEDYARNAAFVPGLAGGVLELLSAQPGEEILDLGCGDGQLTRRIGDAGARVIGVDSSPQMVEAARALGIAAEVAEAEALPFADGQFDAVFSNAVLHWVRGQDAMLGEVRRVLRPQGRFVAEFGGHGNIAAIHVALRAVFQRHGLDDSADRLNYYPSAESYGERLRGHGFQVRQIALIPRPTPLPESGMEGWLRTFRRGLLEELPEKLRESVVAETVALLQTVLCDEAGGWTADYVRLRFAAVKAPRGTE